MWDPGIVNNPAIAMEMDSEENLYMITGGATTVQKFDKFGNLLLELSTYGVGEGEPLGNLYGLAVNTQDQVVVSDQSNELIHIFNSDGSFVRTISLEYDPDSESEFICSAFGLTTDASDIIYLVNNCTNSILKFGNDGTYLGNWVVYDDEDGRDIALAYLDTDSVGNVYILDKINNVIRKYTNNGVLLEEWGGSGNQEGEFNSPAGLAIDNDGNVYISDPQNGYRIQKFNTDGDFIEMFSEPNGILEDEFINPSELEVDNQGHLYVHDTIRVKVYLDTDAVPEDDPTPTPTDTPTITPTGTVTPTNTPAPTGSQDSTTHKKTSVKSKSPRPPMCRDLAPTSSPDLYQIDVTDTTATLYFAPVTGSVSYYAVSYGYWSGDERFGTSFAQGHSDGAITYTINHLEPGATYHFKVRGGNGCMPGEWGNEIKITTNKSSVPNKKPYYKNLVTKVLNSF